MKTNKYTIQFSMLETMESLAIEISKKEYMAQYAHAQQQLDNYDENDQYGDFEKREYVDDGEKLIRTRTYFTLGCADIILTAYRCKKGYHFAS